MYGFQFQPKQLAIPEQAEPCRPQSIYSARESNQERIRALNRVEILKRTQVDTTPTSPQTESKKSDAVVPEEVQERTVRVKAGDTLYGIALREMGDGSRYKELAEYNNIQNPNQISVGQIIRIPSSTATPSSSSQTETSGNNTEDNALLSAVEEFADRISSSDRSINPARNADGSARTDWSGWCAATMSWFVQDEYQNGIGKGYGDGYGKSGSANQAREMSGLAAAISSDARHQDYAKAPKGAFHWWSGGRYGHVGLDVSGGGEQIFMATGMTGKETVTVGKEGSHLKVVGIEEYNRTHPQYTYEGWTTNYCGAKIDSELLQTKKKVDEE